jgi:DNA-nicking Smr family endonuclease
MDFGDILDEWEKQTAKPAGKRAIRAAERAAAQRAAERAAAQRAAEQATAERNVSVQAGGKDSADRHTETGWPAAQRAKTRDPASQKVDPLTAWLRIHGVQDKDRDAPDDDLSDSEKRQRERKRLINKSPDAVLDLHGLTRDEAWDRLGMFFYQAKSHGAEKVLIIHGKGNHSEGEAILKRTTLQYIEQCPFAGQHGHPPAEGGGSGATWVILKKDITARDK